MKRTNETDAAMAKHNERVMLRALMRRKQSLAWMVDQLILWNRRNKEPVMAFLEDAYGVTRKELNALMAMAEDAEVAATMAGRGGWYTEAEIRKALGFKARR